MNGNANFAYQTPGQYKVFFMDLSSLILDALSQYDARKKAQAAKPDKMVSHVQLISQTGQAYQSVVAIQSIDDKAKDKAFAEKKINF